MADRNPSSAQTQRPTTTTTRPTTSAAFLRKLQEHSPNSTQLAGLLTLLVTGSILLLLTGLTVAGTIMGLIFFSPLIIVSSPIWVPAGTLLFLATAGFLSMCGFGLVLVASVSWMYRYFRGLHPPGSDRVDYARNRIYDTASHVKDYAREYGGYLQSKVKDAAPGA
ncbi:oleosin G [Gastrolobium bilobum]|uniref:oleosin G n=1 Tax=Gastrolobium bilobum TaxID=150636 RepID=UPI002AB11B6A|nr:oleosin G [Gastrolobium bilobum]